MTRVSRRHEGPFGDQTAITPWPELSPVFHVTAATYRKDTASYWLRQNQTHGVMWKWFFRRPAPIPTENVIRQRLQAALCLVQEQKERRIRSTVPTTVERRNRGQEILPPDEPDATIPCRLLPSLSGGSTLAAALESILQGKRVSAELFTQLYRGGFVFKDPRGQWRITAMGKELIEKHKLLTPVGCLVAGVTCVAGWNR